MQDLFAPPTKKELEYRRATRPLTDFEKTIKSCKEEVASWPEWKRQNMEAWYNLYFNKK